MIFILHKEIMIKILHLLYGFIRLKRILWIL